MTKWHTRFLRLAAEIATWSRDPSTKVGAVITRDRRILTTGYNGIPAGVDDLPERLERPAKYLWTEHAERNAVLQAAHVGLSLRGSTIYVASTPRTLFVCSDCARAIVTAGICRVVCRASEDPEDWAESCRVARHMLSEADVEVVECQE